MSGELFKSLSGIRPVHVPYKEAAIGTSDVVSGQRDVDKWCAVATAASITVD